MHEVAVLGGGIAGAAAALRLARAGLRPLWIAPASDAGLKPGEHLSAAANPLLRTLGSDALLRAEVHRHAHSTYSAWGGDVLIERNAITELGGQSTVLDRTAFETALSAQAMTAGAQRIEQSALRVQAAPGLWHIDTPETAFKAAFVFDATGRKAIVGAQYSARFQADKLNCQYGVFPKKGTASARPVTLIEAAKSGWWYLSMLADERVVVNFYSDADMPVFENSELAQEARKTRFIAAYLDDYGYDACGPVKRITTNTSWIAPVIGAGYAAIGDAAAAFDPLSSHGMTTALWSAIQASEAYLKQDKAKMQDYADQTAKGVQDYLQARQRVYAQERRWPDAPFWRRRNAAMQEQQKAKIIA